MQSTASPDTEYYTRLGLECDPFGRDAMPDFFFVGAQRRFLVQRAVHALYFSGTTVLLWGADGAGKTRLIGEIEAELKGLADICRIEATVLMDAAEIRGLIAGALGLPASVAVAAAELVRALELLRPADGDPQPVLVAIDAAHLLSTTALAECSALIAGSGGRLRLLLAGEADLVTAWRQAQAGAAEELELAPLDCEETADYVRTKLQAAGYRGTGPLSDAEFDLLFAQSGGNFAAINAFAPQLLVCPAEPATVARRIKALPPLHIGVIAALLAVVILLLVYRGGGKTQSATDVQLPQMAAANRSAPTSGAHTQAAPDAANSAEQNTVPLQLPAATQDNGTGKNATSAAESIPATRKLAPAKVMTATEKQAASETGAKPVTGKAASGTVTRKTVETVSSVHKTVATRPRTTAFDADERALLAFPATHYVLQLMATDAKATLDKFANDGGKGLKLYSYQRLRHGKPWLIVVTGPYPSKAAAQAALLRLPAAARRGKPWPRPLASVQADIRAQHRR